MPHLPKGAQHPCRPPLAYNHPMQRKVFWLTFTFLGVVADVALPLWWALAATIPIGVFCWWLAYRSDWF